MAHCGMQTAVCRRTVDLRDKEFAPGVINSDLTSTHVENEQRLLTLTTRTLRFADKNQPDVSKTNEGHSGSRYVQQNTGEREDRERERGLIHGYTPQGQACLSLLGHFQHHTFVHQQMRACLHFWFLPLFLSLRRDFLLHSLTTFRSQCSGV